MAHVSSSSCKEPIWTSSFRKIWTVNFALFGWEFMLTSPFSFYIKQLGGSEFLLGLAAGGFALTTFVMRPLAGWLMDNKSRSSLLIWSSLSLVLITFLYLTIPILSIVIILRVVSGFLFSGATTASFTNACDSVPANRFGEGISFLGLGNTLASALGPALGLAIMAKMGFTALFTVCIAILMTATFLARKLSYKTINPLTASSGQKKHKFSSLFNAYAIPASLIILFCSIPYGGVSIFIALHGDYSGLGSGGLFFMVIAIGTGSTRLFAGRVADKRGERPMILLGGTGIIVSMLLLLLDSSACYYLSGLFFGFGFALSYTGTQTMAMRIVPMEKRGAASSTFLCFCNIGVALGGITAGWFATIWNYQLMFGSMSVFVIISLLIYVLWASKTPSAFKNYIRSAGEPS